jgi:Txe/YoeB family toxin of Txe-Axe toxin-antitoxin module
MGFVKPADGVTFAEDELEQAFNSLADNSPLKKSINKAIHDLKENIFCGEPIRKELIPKEYIKKYKINNLWLYPLSKGWRLVYSIVNPDDIEILAVIIECFNHPSYERRFGYK